MRMIEYMYVTLTVGKEGEPSSFRYYKLPGIGIDRALEWGVKRLAKILGKPADGLRVIRGHGVYDTGEQIVVEDGDDRHLVDVDDEIGMAQVAVAMGMGELEKYEEAEVDND